MKRSNISIGIALFFLFGALTLPGNTVHGQVPPTSAKLTPGKLTEKKLPQSNPLRGADELPEGYSSAMTERLQRAVSEEEELTEPMTLNEPTAITQTAMEAETPPAKRQKTVSPFADFPVPPDSTDGSLLESSGFAEVPVENLKEPTVIQPRTDNIPFTPKNDNGAYVPLSQENTGVENELRSAPISSVRIEPLQRAVASPLNNADPFAEVSEPAKVPPPAHTPITAANQNPFAEPAPVNTKTASPVRSAPPKLSPNLLEEGSGLPGPSVLEGLQTAYLSIEKVLPSEVKLDEPATILTVLHNTGRSTAKNIVLKDKVPKGTKLLSTSPESVLAPNGDLVWTLGSLEANEKITVEMKLLPQNEGEIGSVASVSYSAEASARLEVTRPMLKVEVKAPTEVRHGEAADIEITISNPGTATATGIILEEYVPDGLFHQDGKILVNKNVDSLRPKEAKRLTLQLMCTGQGNLTNRLIVKANGNLAVEEKTVIRALAPILELGITGANQQFLERQSTYRLTVANKGTTAAQDVDLVATLPSAVKFVSTNQSGVYEPQTHTVHWALEELPEQEAGEIELNLMPIQTGEHVIRFKGTGQNNLKEETLKTVTIGGLPALSFEVVGSSNLIELGKEVVYEVRVQNKGTKKAENVKVRMSLSEGLQFTRADGPVRHQSNNGVVIFEVLPQLEAKGEKVYKVGAKCLLDGDHRISVQVGSDDLRLPITKEESTKVFK